MRPRAKYVVDKKGKRRGVVLSVRDYDKLLQEIEDLRDALELDERVRTVKDLIPYKEVRDRLKAAGRM